MGQLEDIYSLHARQGETNTFAFINDFRLKKVVFDWRKRHEQKGGNSHSLCVSSESTQCEMEKRKKKRRRKVGDIPHREWTFTGSYFLNYSPVDSRCEW